MVVEQEEGRLLLLLQLPPVRRGEVKLKNLKEVAGDLLPPKRNF
jgi:hypothetical protein